LRQRRRRVARDPLQQNNIFAQDGQEIDLSVCRRFAAGIALFV
jgi:hypothetical protein